MEKKISNPIKVFIVIILVMLDQGIKLIVKNYYGFTLPIINDLIYFKPHLNIEYSWLNASLELGLGKIFHIILNVLIIIIGFYAFRFYYYKKKEIMSISIIEVLLFGGAFSALIDRIFWGGSLDYIMLKGFFIFDLKDLYITIFEIGILILIIKNWSTLIKVSNKKLLSELINFIKNDDIT